MAKPTYAQQLLDPRWQRKRLEVLESADWSCENCGDKTVTLHVHHKRYVKGRMAWEYEREELVALCEPCHAEEHGNRKLIEDLLVEAGPGYASAIAALIGGYLNAECIIEPWTGEEARQTDEAFYEYGVCACVLSRIGIQERRDLIRGIVKKFHTVSPSVATLIEDWDASK